MSQNIQLGEIQEDALSSVPSSLRTTQSSVVNLPPQVTDQKQICKDCGTIKLLDIECTGGRIIRVNVLQFAPTRGSLHSWDMSKPISHKHAWLEIIREVGEKSVVAVRDAPSVRRRVIAAISSESLSEPSWHWACIASQSLRRVCPSRDVAVKSIVYDLGVKDTETRYSTTEVKALALIPEEASLQLTGRGLASYKGRSNSEDEEPQSSSDCLLLHHRTGRTLEADDSGSQGKNSLRELTFGSLGNVFICACVDALLGTFLMLLRVFLTLLYISQRSITREPILEKVPDNIENLQFPGTLSGIESQTSGSKSTSHPKEEPKLGNRPAEYPEKMVDSPKGAPSKVSSPECEGKASHTYFPVRQLPRLHTFDMSERQHVVDMESEIRAAFNLQSSEIERLTSSRVDDILQKTPEPVHSHANHLFSDQIANSGSRNADTEGGSPIMNSRSPDRKNSALFAPPLISGSQEVLRNLALPKAFERESRSIGPCVVPKNGLVSERIQMFGGSVSHIAQPDRVDRRKNTIPDPSLSTLFFKNYSGETGMSEAPRSGYEANKTLQGSCSLSPNTSSPNKSLLDESSSSSGLLPSEEAFGKCHAASVHLGSDLNAFTENSGKPVLDSMEELHASFEAPALRMFGLTSSLELLKPATNDNERKFECPDLHPFPLAPVFISDFDSSKRTSMDDIMSTPETSQAHVLPPPLLSLGPAATGATSHPQSLCTRAKVDSVDVPRLARGTSFNSERSNVKV